MFLSDIGMYDRTVEAFQYSLDTYQSGRDLAETYLPLAVNQVWSLSGLKVSWQVLRKFESSLVRFLAHDCLHGPRQ